VHFAYFKKSHRALVTMVGIYRSKQETATRMSCYLHWVADQFGMKGKNSKFEATWSTGCPQDQDISLGAPGGKLPEKDKKNKNTKERRGNNNKRIKGNKTKKKVPRIMKITDDNNDNIKINLKGIS